MADLTVNITETITLNGQTQAETYTQTISGINYIDTRNLSCPSGSQTTLFNLEANPGAGTFSTSSFSYGRITNLSSVPVKLIVSASTVNSNFLISTGSSFIISTSKITGSIDTNFSFEDIHSVIIEPSGSAAQVEYYIATT